jgi:hypothetical protein
MVMHTWKTTFILPLQSRLPLRRKLKLLLAGLLWLLVQLLLQQVVVMARGVQGPSGTAECSPA